MEIRAPRLCCNNFILFILGLTLHARHYLRKALWLLLIILAPLLTLGQTAAKDSAEAANYLTEARGLFFSDRVTCLSKVLAGLAIAEKIDNKPMQSILGNMAGALYSYQAKFDVSLKYLNHALELTNITNDLTQKSKVLGNIGLNYQQQGNQLKAIEFSLMSIKILDAIKSYTTMGGAYANISNSYYNLKLPAKALAYADSAMRYFKQTNQQTGIANIYNFYGVYYADKKDYQKSLKYYFDALKIKKENNDVIGQANTLVNIGTNYNDLKDYNKAKVNLTAAKKLYVGLNDPKGIAEADAGLADLKSATNDSTGVADEIKVFKYAQKNTTVEQQRDVALNIAQKYRAKADYKNSLNYYFVYDSLKDATISASVIKQVAEVETRFQTEKKQHQIMLLNKQNTIQNLQLAKKNMTIAIIGGILLLFIIISFQFYSSNKLKQDARLQAEVIHQQSLASKGIIEAEERERQRIAGDLHDGVGQLFSTVKMNMDVLMERFLIKQPDADLLAEKTLAMVVESCAEVRSIAHQMMPNALVKTGLVSAVRDFINKIPNDKLKIAIAAKGINDRLESSTETVLYRVIQESVNNVIKHADATLLDILIISDRNEITVSIEDNGKGFDSKDKSKMAGIGLKNMISRVEYLKGTVEVSSSPGKGTLVAIYIPLT